MALHDTKGEDWAEMAKLYQKLTVEVASRPITKMLELANARVPFAKATGIHDNGTGPGAVIARIISDYGSQLPSSCLLSCSDFSQAMIDQVSQRKEAAVEADASSPWRRVQIDVLNAMDLQGIADDSRSHVTAGWVYFMTPEPQKCLRESRRVLRADGVLVASSWKGSDWLELMRLVTQVKPGVTMPEMPEEWTSAPAVKQELEKANFRDVEAYEVPVEMTFESHDELADMLTNKMPHMKAMMKDYSEKERRDAQALIAQEARRMAPTSPYTLHGVSLVGVGRK